MRGLVIGGMGLGVMGWGYGMEWDGMRLGWVIYMRRYRMFLV